MMLLKKAMFALVAGAFAAPALAGDFKNLPGPVPPATTVAAVSGSNSPNADQLYLEAQSFTFLDAAQLIPQTIEYNAIATTGTLPRAVTGSGTLSLLAHQVTEDILVGGEEYGNLYDFVFRDSRDNKLVFGTRVMLGVEDDQAQDGELNFLFRHGFKEGATTFSAAAAWLFQTDSDLRLYNVARTGSTSLTAAKVYDPDTVRLQSDVNKQEGNPYSGLFLLKTDALHYTTASGAVGVFQAGEEGQPAVGADFAGFVPTNTAPVPEPSTWALLAGGLGMVGFAARRRRA